MKKFKVLVDTVKNTIISPSFLVWAFCGKAQFTHSFGQITVIFAVRVLCKTQTLNSSKFFVIENRKPERIQAVVLKNSN